MAGYAGVLSVQVRTLCNVLRATAARARRAWCTFLERSISGRTHTRGGGGGTRGRMLCGRVPLAEGVV